jgi:hypothetical protein
LHRFEERTCRIKQSAPLVHFIAQQKRECKKNYVDGYNIKCNAAGIYVVEHAANL